MLFKTGSDCEDEIIHVKQTNGNNKNKLTQTF